MPEDGEGGARARRCRCEPVDAEAVYEEFRRHVLPYPLGNIHPRFWGWVIGTGTPLGRAGRDAGRHHESQRGRRRARRARVEHQVLDWCKQMLGYPARGERHPGERRLDGEPDRPGGGAQRAAEIDVARAGLHAAPRRMMLYASTETHNSVKKAVSAAGAGPRGAARDPGRRASSGSTSTALGARSPPIAPRGCHPFCVVGNAGTVNTGAIDDLDTLADLCRRRGAVVPRRRRVRRAGRAISERCVRWCAAWSAPTRWRSTCTSGCTCPTRWAACWCATPSAASRRVHLARRLPHARRARRGVGPRLVQRLRHAALARIPRAQDLDVAQGARRSPSTRG